MTQLPDGFTLLPLAADRLADVLDLDLWAFPSGESLEDLLKAPSPLTWERAFGIETSGDPGRLVGLHASYPFANTPVPGGRLAVSGLSWVGVHPQFRRRGLLRGIIGAHFAHCVQRGEPLSMLYAAEPAIYGRFGYGLASYSYGLKLPRRAALRDVPGTGDLTVRIETVDPARHSELIGALHAGVDRPGWVTRETPELAAAWVDDAPVWRNGREALRILIVERDGTPAGYATFRRKSEWGEGGAEGTVQVSELVATDPASCHVLWSRLLDLDLTTHVQTGFLAGDDPLFSLLVDVRAGRGTIHDNLWVRIIDLPAALAGRQYQADVDVVLQVSDTLVPANAGRWRLSGTAFSPATVQRTDAEPDLSLDIRELGASYLGGVPLTEAAAAGLVTEHTPAALRRTSAAFGWPVAPLASWIF